MYFSSVILHMGTKFIHHVLAHRINSYISCYSWLPFFETTLLANVFMQHAGLIWEFITLLTIL